MWHPGGRAGGHSVSRFLCHAPSHAVAASRPPGLAALPSTCLRWLKDAFVAYDKLLLSHRLATTTVSGAVLALLGDAFTQAATQPGLYDISRGIAFAAFGATVTGPVNYVWLGRLADMVTRLAPAGGARAVFWKMAFQTFFFQPLVYVPLFFAFTALCRGWTGAVAWERMQAEYPGTLRSLWIFWTPICVAVFAFLPVRQQAMCFSAISLCWNAILSFLSFGREALAQSSDAAPPAHGSSALRTPSSDRFWQRWHQPPPAIIDNAPLYDRSGPSQQSIIGFLMGPGLM